MGEEADSKHHQKASFGKISLSAEMQGLIHGVWAPRFGDPLLPRNCENALGTVAWQLVRQGVSFEEAVPIVGPVWETPGHVLATAWGASPTTFAQVWDQASVRFYRNAAHCDEWATIVFYAWPWSSGARLRVALALAHVARQRGFLSFRSSVRRLAEVAGVGWSGASGADTKSVRSALAFLEDRGLVVRRVVSDSDESERHAPATAKGSYTLVEPSALPSLLGLGDDYPTTSYLALCSRSTGVLSARDEWLHPVFEEAALGMSACRIWDLLRLLGRTNATELQAALGWRERRVRAQLSNLAELGLASWWSPANEWSHRDADLDLVAAELGMADRADHRRSAFARQRSGFNSRFKRVAEANRVATSADWGH
ncbi:MAG: hypothetical protein U0Q03_06530 [Acidimicrobiales bacterium]